MAEERRDGGVPLLTARERAASPLFLAVHVGIRLEEELGTAVAPARDAVVRGALPPLLARFTFAPLLSNSFTASWCPFRLLM